MNRRLGDVGAQVFDNALAGIHDAAIRPEVRLEEAPAPTRIAPHAVALTAEVLRHPADEDELATGRFVVLHDPSEPEPWGGPWRVVTYAKAALEPELGTDPALSQVGWSWLMDSLQDRGVGFSAAAGTVTRVVSERFGDLADESPSVELEIRASWSPLSDEIGDHLSAWADLLCTIAGLPPLPEGVVALPGTRR